MKRIISIILSFMILLAGTVSCGKINDLDKRLSDVENSFSQLQAQVAAGAYITSVDTAADGITFILSNSQTYKVVNGKNGTDGEAILADVTIENDFIVLTLKNGETLRISYQNPLSMVSLNIVPDYTDGTVKNYSPVTNCIFLSIEVTPSQYAEKLSDTSRFIYKAIFSPVQTKSGFNDAFTIAPSSIIYNRNAPIPFLELCFELDEMSIFMLENGTYAVSCSIEDKDGVHGASTQFVPLHVKSSNPSDSENPGEADKMGEVGVTIRSADFTSVSDQIASGAGILDFGKVKIKKSNGSFGLTESGELILDGDFEFSILYQNTYYSTTKLKIAYTQLEKEPAACDGIDWKKKIITFTDSVKGIKVYVKEMTFTYNGGVVKVKE